MDSSLHLVRIPAGTMVDGAVAELYFSEDGTMAADIRIPGPPVK